MLAIYRDTQDLGIYPLEPIQGDLVRGDLRRSYRRPGEWKERQHNIFLTVKIA